MGMRVRRSRIYSAKHLLLTVAIAVGPILDVCAETNICGTYASPAEWQSDLSITVRVGEKSFGAWVSSDVGNPGGSNRPAMGTYVREDNHLYVPLSCSLEEWNIRGLTDPAIIAHVQRLTATNINEVAVLMDDDALEDWSKRGAIDRGVLLIKVSDEQSYRLKSVKHPSMKVLGGISTNSPAAVVPSP